MSELPTTYNDRVINAETRMDHALYRFSAMPDRPRLIWPGGARVAVAVVVNVEVGDLVTSPMNVREFSYRDYGPRVGLFRLMAMLDELGIKASMPVSDLVLARAPAVVEQALARDWEFVGHGAKVNRVVNAAMPEADERAYLAASLEALRAATGRAPRGWLGPGGSQSRHTTRLLAELGFDYTLDWGNDDQPYDFLVPQGRLAALPYSPDTSDAAVIQAQSHTPWEFATALEDHLEGLLADGAGTVMTLGLQAQVSGQPFRARHLREVLRKAARTEGVWFATGAEIIDAWRAQAGI